MALMRHFAACGRKAAALAEFGRLSRHRRENYGATPSDAAAGLAASIRGVGPVPATPAVTAPARIPNLTSRRESFISPHPNLPIRRTQAKDGIAVMLRIATPQTVDSFSRTYYWSDSKRPGVSQKRINIDHPDRCPEIRLSGRGLALSAGWCRHSF
jgi:hypothetical protein